MLFFGVCVLLHIDWEYWAEQNYMGSCWDLYRRAEENKMKSSFLNLLNLNFHIWWFAFSLFWLLFVYLIYWSFDSHLFSYSCHIVYHMGWDSLCHVHILKVHILDAWWPLQEVVESLTGKDQWEVLMTLGDTHLKKTVRSWSPPCSPVSWPWGHVFPMDTLLLLSNNPHRPRGMNSSNMDQTLWSYESS